MHKYICIGLPDEENIHHGSHTQRETWECEASSFKEAERKALEHFYYFHDVVVYAKDA